MKILLLTDVPADKGFTAGLVSGQLCRFLPADSIACFAVVHPDIGARQDPEFDWVPIEYADKPREYTRKYRSRYLKTLVSYSRDRYNAWVALRPVVRLGAAFARNFGADMVWAVLQGPSMFRLAKWVSDELGLPLRSQVYDPPNWWLISNNFDRFSRARILREYEEVLRKSVTCGAASWAMAQEYQRLYGTRGVALVPSLDRHLATPVAERANRDDEFVIGMAGQIYATAEWETFLTALDTVGWEIAGRRIKVRLLTRYAVLSASSHRHIEFMGWCPQAETIRLLSEVDANYCPYRFGAAFEVEARLCFPSKLTTYFATGRPVFFHGPDYSSPAHVLEEFDSGIVCSQMVHKAIIEDLERLIVDQELYQRLARNTRTTLMERLTLEVYRRSFADFLQVDEDFLLPVSEATPAYPRTRQMAHREQA